jgi:hypothetical protein
MKELIKGIKFLFSEVILGFPDGDIKLTLKGKLRAILLSWGVTK